MQQTARATLTAGTPRITNGVAWIREDTHGLADGQKTVAGDRELASRDNLIEDRGPE